MPTDLKCITHWPWRQAGFIAVVLLTLVLADQRLRFTESHTANIFFWDQWDIYNPLFKGEGWWSIFSHQHGPHRQGLGFLFTAGLAHLTGWDARGDALLTVTVTVLATSLALPLACKCGSRPGIALATIPVLFLTMRQFEAWIGPANPSHGAFPVLLLMLYGFTWFMRCQLWRLGLQVILTFFLVFTGFGLFGGVLSLVLLGLEIWHAKRTGDRRVAWRAAAAFLLVVATWLLFLWGYKSQPAVPDFQFPHERPWEYGYFSALMMASYAGVHGRLWLALTVGFILLLLLASVAVKHGLRVLRTSAGNSPASTVIFILSSFTLLYCINTAFGRVMLGWQEAPYAPRYVTLVIPGMFALYLHGETLANRYARNGWWTALILLAICSGFSLSADDRKAVEWYSENRESWRKVYLSTGSQPKADAATIPDQGYTIYPGDLSSKLSYLREHQLNLYKPDTLSR